MYEWASRMEELRRRKGLSRREVARRAGLEPGMFNKNANGLVQNPRGDFFERVAKVLDTTEEYLRFGKQALKKDERPLIEGVPNFRGLPQDVPVMGTGQAGVEDAVNVEGPVNFVRRPPGLLHAKNIYSIYVSGESMCPRYLAGEMVFVDPSRPVAVGDHVVVQCMVDGGGQDKSLIAFVKVVSGRQSGNWLFSQYNPSGAWVPPHPVHSVHRISTTTDLFGV